MWQIFTDEGIHFTCKIEVATHLLIQISDLTKFDDKWNTGLTRFYGKVH